MRTNNHQGALQQPPVSGFSSKSTTVLADGKESTGSYGVEGYSFDEQNAKKLRCISEKLTGVSFNI